MNKIAIIIPALNEADSIQSNLGVILSHTNAIPDVTFTLLVIDDGSTDTTADKVRGYARTQKNVHLISLSRHFGKEAAISAGLKAANIYDAAIVMDSDLQHPPSLILPMVEYWRQGLPVVEAVKKTRGNETVLKSLLVKSYYKLFNYFTRMNISGDTDFKLLDQAVVKAYCKLPERERFFRGLVKWMNFSSQQISFDVSPSTRKRSAWRSRTLFLYAVASITSFTAFPLQIVTALGVMTFLLSVVIGSIALIDKLSDRAVDGFTTVILLILLIGSVLMFSIGLIGVYIGKIYDEVKRRPKYIIKEQNNFIEGKKDLLILESIEDNE